MPLPEAVSALRCQRGPHEPDGDHLFAHIFYRDSLAPDTTLEKLGFSDAEAFAAVRSALHGGVFIGGSTADGKSTTLAARVQFYICKNFGGIANRTAFQPTFRRILPSRASPHTQLAGQNPRPERRFVTKLPISALKRLGSDLNNL